MHLRSYAIVVGYVKRGKLVRAHNQPLLDPATLTFTGSYFSISHSVVEAEWPDYCIAKLVFERSLLHFQLFQFLYAKYIALQSDMGWQRCED